MIVDCIFLLLIMLIFTFYSYEKMLMIYCDQKKKGYPAAIHVCVCLSVKIDQLRSMDLDLA